MDYLEAFYYELGLLKRYLRDEKNLTVWQKKKLNERISDMNEIALNIDCKIIQLDIKGRIVMRFPNAETSAAYNQIPLSIINLILSKKILMYENNIWTNADECINVDHKFLTEYLSTFIIDKHLILT